MRFLWTLLAIGMSATIARGADTKPAQELARLKEEFKAAGEVAQRDWKPGATEAERDTILARIDKQTAAIGRRVLVMAQSYPDAPETLAALDWIVNFDDGAETGPVIDAAYDLMTGRYLDKDAILPIVRLAWSHPARGPHLEAFLRTAVARSPNPRVRALACFSLGRLRQEQIVIARDLDHPVRGAAIRKELGPDRARNLLAVTPQDRRREAEAYYERTIRDYGEMQPMGTAFPPLGEQARGDLFRLRHLEPGCTVPEIAAEDIDGRPMTLSDFRGKVVVISFWATWCGPCMAMVPDEKALVERMKGRPFVLIGVNGDEDRAAARKVATEKGMNWRSFWDGGRTEGTAVKWGVNAWPTVYLIDARGVIRDDALFGADLDKAVADLVAEAEAAGQKP